MRINTSSNIKFQGYDARPLKGFFMGASDRGIVREMQKIGQKEDFKIFSKIKAKHIYCGETVPELIPYDNAQAIWAQDVWTFCKNKLYTAQKIEKVREICDFFKIKNIDSKKHVAGGNMFFIKNGKQDDLLVGQKELEKLSVPELKEKYNVEKVHVIPQMDYHLDLFIRPLDKKRILVADDFLTLETLAGGLKNLVNFIASRPVGERKKYKNMFLQFGSRVKNFQNIINMNPRCQVDEICEILEVNGYKPIRVPGRIYDIYESTQAEPFLSHHCNYINANALINNNKELVYITNKSNIDKTLGLTQKMSEKINFSFEKSFLKSISPYIDPEHIYFVKGDNNFVANEMLTTYQGGIHCTCSEVPKINKRNSYDSSSKNKHRV